MSNRMITYTHSARLIKMTRISKDRDNQTSIRSQHHEIDYFVKGENAEIVAEFEEIGTSGFKNIRRPKLDEALAMVANGLADGLVVWKIDRFTRKGAMEIFRILAQISHGNGFLVAVADGIDTRRDGMVDIIKLTVIAELAKAESEARSQRALSWHRDRIRQGDIAIGGPRPYGYDRPEPNVLNINDDEEAVILEAYKRVANGEALRAICRDFTHRGIKSPTGKVHWPHSTLKHVLINPTTAGFRVHDGEFIRGSWSPIIDEKTWKATRAILMDGSRNHRDPHRTGRKQMLTGLITCGKCGQRMRVGSPINGGKERYLCPCGMSLYSVPADRYVGQFIIDSLDDDAWQALRSRGRKSDPNAIGRLRKALDHERAKWLDEQITDEEWDDAQRDIKARVAKLETSDAVNVPNVESVRKAWPTMDIEDQRLIVTAVTESIIIAAPGKGCRNTERITVNMAKLT